MVYGQRYYCISLKKSLSLILVYRLQPSARLICLSRKTCLIMKTIFPFVLLILVSLESCNSGKVDADVNDKNWFSSCSSFTKKGDGYILGGCGYTVTIPLLSLQKGKSFVAKGTIIARDGKGNSKETEIQLNGNVSGDGKVLYANFEYDGRIMYHEFTTAISTAICDCISLI